MTSTLAETAGTCLSAVIASNHFIPYSGASCAGAVSNQRVREIGNEACFGSNCIAASVYGIPLPKTYNARSLKTKTDSKSCPFSEKVFLLLMGCSKNYIMYWGLRVLLYQHYPQKCAQT